MPYPRILLALPALALLGSAAQAEVLHVAPEGRLSLPSQAALLARDGDVVEIAAGDYRNDVAVWQQSNLTIRAVGIGPVRLPVDGKLAEGKAIWVTKGANVHIQGIEFSGATTDDANGAGIRHEGGDLLVEDCSFHHNQDGILMGDLARSNVVVEHSEFAHNGAGDGQSHNIYVGRVASFTFRFNASHHAVVGHTVKSRAQRNVIAYNWLADESDGQASYLIDLPDAGSSLIIGNILQKGAEAENPTLIAYGAEEHRNPGHDLYVVNNTLVSIGKEAVFINNHTSQPALISNNLMIGPGEPIKGPARGQANQHHDDKSGMQVVKAAFRQPATLLETVNAKPVVRSIAALDFHLTPSSPAVNAGVVLTGEGGFDLVPRYQLREPMREMPRPQRGAIDIGAYELRE